MGLLVEARQAPRVAAQHLVPERVREGVDGAQRGARRGDDLAAGVRRRRLGRGAVDAERLEHLGVEEAHLMQRQAVHPLVRLDPDIVRQRACAARGGGEARGRARPHDIRVQQDGHVAVSEGAGEVPDHVEDVKLATPLPEVAVRRLERVVQPDDLDIPLGKERLDVVAIDRRERLEVGVEDVARGRVHAAARRERGNGAAPVDGLELARRRGALARRRADRGSRRPEARRRATSRWSSRTAGGSARRRPEGSGRRGSERRAGIDTGGSGSVDARRHRDPARGHTGRVLTHFRSFQSHPHLLLSLQDMIRRSSEVPTGNRDSPDQPEMVARGASNRPRRAGAPSTPCRSSRSRRRRGRFPRASRPGRGGRARTPRRQAARCARPARP